MTRPKPTRQSSTLLAGILSFVETAAPYVTHAVENADQIGKSAGQLVSAVEALDVASSASAVEALMSETGLTMGNITAVLNASKSVVIPKTTVAPAKTA